MFLLVFTARHFVSIIKISDDVGVVGKICGNRTRYELLSRSNVVHVSFVSDCGVNDYGFEAEYQEEYSKLFGGDSNVFVLMTFIATSKF